MELFIESKPFFTIIHIIAAIVGVVAALTSDALFSFYSHDKKLDRRELRRLNTLSTIVWVSLVVIIVSGIGIFLSDPATYAVSAKFLSKMSVVVILSINGYLLHRLVKPHLTHPGFLTSKKEHRARMIAFTCGAVSLVSWLYALTLAILKNLPHTYGEIMSLYLLILICAIIVALFVERRTCR